MNVTDAEMSPLRAGHDTPPVALTIAGSDSGGGAGIQADLTTFAALGVHGASVLTALTAQNTVDVAAVHVPPVAFLRQQLEAVLGDLPVAATKTGMLASAEVVSAVAERARSGELGLLVVDPVLVASSGARLFDADFERAYLDDLLPWAHVITPNSREAAVLLGRTPDTIRTVDDQAEAAQALASRLGRSEGEPSANTASASGTASAGTPGPAWIVVKGGHLPPRDAHGSGGGEAIDVVLEVATGAIEELRAPWIDTGNDHGTGCTFAAATTALLAKSEAVLDALRGAKAFVHTGLMVSSRWQLGSGHGPVAHIFRG
jgi:hydroxymethylpyrimidine/phosphomethylpyrimidine kinase